MSKHKAILLDAAGAIILFAITAVAIRSADTQNAADSTRLVIAVLTVNAALIAARIRIHVDQRASELSDHITSAQTELSQQVAELKNEVETHVRLFAPGRVLGNLVEMAIIKNSSQVQELVGEFRHACDTLRRVVELVYEVENRKHELYKHDIAKIEELRPGASYRATHSFAVMSGVWEGNGTGDAAAGNGSPLDESVMFRAYMKAQYAARERGVNVTRIYIADDIDAVLKQPKIAEHFREMCKNKIKVKIIRRALLSPDMNEDFIIIGDDLLGVGYTEGGSVVRAEYRKNNPHTAGETFDSYLRYFKALEDEAQDCSELSLAA